MSDLKSVQNFQNVSAHKYETHSSDVKATVIRRATYLTLIIGTLSYLVLSKGYSFRGMCHAKSGNVEEVTDLSLLGPVGTVKWYECEGEGILPGAECGHIMYVPFYSM